ncbi:MAG: NYN domain-containing protein, partial [Hyphomicrobiaceae bacterium]|nr:NYN domain-containing protein [Hyphomicrobiaceae bacterium]
AGYEVIDCPPLTNQLKNGSDIRMVLDMRDLLDHTPQIDEFIIMSGDSDFVPILLRLRAHDRRTMIYGSLQTAKSYTSLADEIITEEALVSFLHQSAGRPAPRPAVSNNNPAPVDPLLAARREIIEEVAKIVEASDKPVPMELLATTVRNTVGLKRTIDTKWAGHGQFSVLLAEALSQEFELSSQPPYMVWHKKLHQKPTPIPAAAKSEAPQSPEKIEAAKRKNTKHSEIKSVIDNILHLTDIPPLSARYYQRLFQLISEELTEKGFSFNETAENTAARGKAIKLPVDPTHVQAILHRIRRHGHWFGQNDTAPILATVFRDSVLSQCLESKLEFSDADLLMVNSWFIPASPDKKLTSDEKKPRAPQDEQLQDLKIQAKNTASG